MLEANEKLRIARKQRNWSQEQAAAAIGIDRKTYIRWETGQNSPQPGTLDLACKAFKLSAEELGFSSISPAPEGKEKDLPLSTSAYPQDGYKHDVSGSILLAQKIGQIIRIVSSQNEQISPCNAIQAIVHGELEMLDKSIPQNPQDEYKISRRQALITVAALPTTLLFWQAGNLVADPNPVEFLPQCAASITACWHLLKGDGLAAVEHILPKFVPTLTNMALYPSVYQQEAAFLGAQANILQAKLAMHRLDPAGRERYSRAAVKCGRLSGNNLVTAAALAYLGYTYSFCYRPKRPEQAIDVFLEGLEVLGNNESLIRSDIAMGLAEAYAQCKEEKKALHYITLAQDAFPIYPENDASFIYASCGLNTLYQWEGKMYLELAESYENRGYQQRAWDAVTRSVDVQSISELSTTETIIYQANAARLLGDLHTYVSCLRDGAQMAIVLGSQKRYVEAYEAYEKTPEEWRIEPQIKLLTKDIFRQMPVRNNTR